MKRYTRKQYIVEILEAFTSGSIKIPTRDGILNVGVADLAQAARRSMQVRELYDDFLPRDAIINEASVARGLTMFGYVYASLATASSPAEQKLGFSTMLLDHIDKLGLPARVTQRLARADILFVGDVLSLGPNGLNAIFKKPDAALLRRSCEDHVGDGQSTRNWPRACAIPVPPADLRRRARIMELPIGKTELAASIARSAASSSLQTVGDLASLTREDLMRRVQVGPLGALAVRQMLAGLGLELGSVGAKLLLFSN
jgi:hypothetical protein